MTEVSRLFIGGEWIRPAATDTREIHNPATLELVGVAAECGAADVAAAVEAAARAQPGWWRIPGVEKATVLHRVATKIRSRERELSRLMTLETGKPLVESVDCIEWVAACFDYYAEVGRRSYGNSIPPVQPHQVNFTIKEPYGVVAAIVPFNFPLLLMAWKVAPALAAGNTLVCKPPQQNPLSNLPLAECYGDLPPGVVNVITGGPPTGELLVRHPPGVAWARLLNAGQVCTSSKRIYVVEPIAADFTRRLERHVGTLTVGDPLDAGTDIGPLISAEALARVEQQVAVAVRQGATLRAGGTRMSPPGLGGHFFAPTILTDVPHGSLPTTEEIFGPVLSLTIARNADEAIAMANDSKFGLGASVYTTSLQLALKAMEHVKAGTFWVNDPLTDNDAGPFGGMRWSGVGRELGEEGLDAFREPKHVHIDYVMEPKDYWYPYKNRKVPE
ncbi:MAG: aldehyde dehydrogenase family protein [Gemmatimonadales bacterium]